MTSHDGHMPTRRSSGGRRGPGRCTPCHWAVPGGRGVCVASAAPCAAERCSPVPQEHPPGQQTQPCTLAGGARGRGACVQV